MKKISVIIVNYNKLQYTLDLLRSIPEENFEDLDVIVVDNGSRVDTGDILINQFPEITYIRSNKNLGYSGGYNLGLSYAMGDYILFLENDTILPAGTIDRLYGILATNPDVGAVSPLIYYWEQPELIQYAGYSRVSRLTGKTTTIGQMMCWLTEDRIEETFFPHRAALMIRKEAISLAGMMPENFFYKDYADLDWGNRIRGKGFKIAVDHGSYILHKETVNTRELSPVETYFNTRNKILYMRRNASGKDLFVFYNFLLFVCVPKKVLKGIFRKEWDQIQALWEGIKWNLTNKPQSVQLGYKLDYTKDKIRV